MCYKKIYSYALVDVVTVPNNDVDIHARNFNDKPLNVPGNILKDSVMNDVSDVEFAYLKLFNDFEDIGWYKNKRQFKKKSTLIKLMLANIILINERSFLWSIKN